MQPSLLRQHACTVCTSSLLPPHLDGPLPHQAGVAGLQREPHPAHHPRPPGALPQQRQVCRQRVVWLQAREPHPQLANKLQHREGERVCMGEGETSRARA